jgi:branched-chain amino acid transport system substrate-binding protein
VAVAGLACASLGLGLAACGSDNGGGGSKVSGNTLHVYSSFPLQGATSAQTKPTVKGIRLAFEQANFRAGKFKLKFTSLDDSTAQAGNWDPGTTAQNARKAAQDKSTIAYIGEFNSGASAISIPITNQAKIPQISPANTYVGLTKNEPGIEKGEPDKYYPTGDRNYVRIVPRDKIQAEALIQTMQRDGCKTTAVANDKDTYGAGLAKLIDATAKSQGFKIASDEGIDKSAPNFRAYASKLKGEGVDCFMFSGVTPNGAIQLYKDVNAALPTAKLYGPDGVCSGGLTDPKQKGLPAKVDKQFQCTVATLPLPEYPGYVEFIKAYRAKYKDKNPDPYAIYGYEAGKLVVDTIKKLGDKGNDREEVIKALFAVKDRASVLGKYSLDKDGDTTLPSYGLYKVGPDNLPLFEREVRPKS